MGAARKSEQSNAGVDLRGVRELKKGKRQLRRRDIIDI